ncbi:hypothetical protein FB451DRAFT_1180927 [Mycena latifolia]|nr:hypothetical protein FB451DRAFT_1180927 [Mycena latifolia]
MPKERRHKKETMQEIKNKKTAESTSVIRRTGVYFRPDQTRRVTHQEEICPSYPTPSRARPPTPRDAAQNPVRINRRLEPAQRAVKIVVRDARLAHELVVRLVRLQRLERRAARQCRSALARGRTEREVRGLGQNGEHPDGRELLAGADERAEVAGGDALGLALGLRAAHELVQRVLKDGEDAIRAREDDALRRVPERT